MRCKILLLLPGFLASCTAPEGYYLYRPSTTVAQQDADKFECRALAAQAIPANTGIAVTPSYRLPAQTTCNGISCTTTGGNVVGGQSYSYDRNEELRIEYSNRCILSRGYQAFKAPRCDADRVPEGITERLKGQLRAPREGACIVETGGRSSNLVYADELR